MSSNITVLYACNDASHYRKMMELSIRSWKRFHPDWKVEIFPLRTPNTFIDTITWYLGSRAAGLAKAIAAPIRKNEPEGRIKAFNEKVDAIRSAKEPCVLFLDCDTFVTRPLTSMIERFQGFDVLTQDAHSIFEPLHGFGDAPFPRISAGAFLMSSTFAEVYNDYARRYPIESLYGADEYIFSYCLHHSTNLRVRAVSDLQVINKMGVKSVVEYLDQAAVVHYAFHKQLMYKQLKALLK